jgi:uncharacterized membrane protein YagU involved in acid resistance
MLTGVVYGIFIWLVMNLIVVPLSNTGSWPFTIDNAVINATILSACIRLPLSYLAHRF